MTGPVANGQVSFWQAQLGPPPRRPELPGPTTADVCVVGAGYTGLWTAWALRQASPAPRVVVLERDHVGFGASGRNGGWLSGLLPGNPARLARGPGGRAGVDELRRTLEQAVDDVIAVCVEEGIDADIVKAGTLAVATSQPQRSRLDAPVLDPPEVDAYVRVAGCTGGSFSPHCARIHPAKLVRGLADAAERRGAEIYERSPALSIAPHRVETPAGPVEARWVVRATEGFTAGLPGLRRALLPMNSSMVVTAPLDEHRWRAIGWARPVTLRTAANAYLYAQRTADGRIALGGRGVPYRWGSRTDVRGVTDASTIMALTAALRSLWPAAAGVAIEHAWCGVLGVARDWCPAVEAEASTGLAWAGGYVGDGVTTAYLAGLTLADLVLGVPSERTRLPWVGRRARRWEPEPLRWLGARGLYALYRAADRAEARGRRPSALATVADRLAGR